MGESGGGPVRRAEGAPFVSRSAELALLDAALKHMGAGGPAVVEVAGEAGIGKSRLLAEFGALARRRGAAVLRGRATEYERHSPFGPFTDAFADADSRMLKVFPALREVPPPVRGTGGPDGPWRGDRFGLHRATAHALRGIRGARLVVVLDDLHWADPASLELVDHLVRHPVPAPFLLVVAHRDRQAPVALSAALSRRADTGAVTRVALGPLSERACVEELAPDLPVPRAAEMYAASEGNPLYFLALLQAHRPPRLPGTSGFPAGGRPPPRTAPRPRAAATRRWTAVPCPRAVTAR